MNRPSRRRRRILVTAACAVSIYQLLLLVSYRVNNNTNTNADNDGSTRSDSTIIGTTADDNNNNNNNNNDISSSSNKNSDNSNRERYHSQQQQQLSSSLSGAAATTKTTAQLAYELAMERYQARRQRQQNAGGAGAATIIRSLKELYNYDDKKRKVLNIIRIPKSSSTALYTTAKAIAGCDPEGYCCLRGQKHCPAPPHLECLIVAGCLGHRPKPSNLNNNNIPTITTIREPASRLLSAFFFKREHRPKPDNDHSWTLFAGAKYVQNPKYHNVITKMLLGRYAYAPYSNNNDDDDDSLFSSKNDTAVRMAQKRLCDMEWFGLASADIGSALLMYEMPPFDKLLPNPIAFGLSPSTLHENEEEKQQEGGNEDVSANKAATTTTTKNNMKEDKKVNLSVDYKTFKEETFVKHNGSALVAKYNAEDIEVYKFAVQLFCARVRETILLHQQKQPRLSSSSSYLLSTPDLYSDCINIDNNNNGLVTSNQLCSAVQ